MKYLVCFLLAVNLALDQVKTSGWQEDMTLFGPDNQYKCNCKELASCDFKNNGYCRNTKCKYGYSGPFCQKKLYHKHLKWYRNQTQKIFTSDRNEINNSLKINFKLKYRIHVININCQSSVSATTVTLFIGSKKFCEEKCEKLRKCLGDATGKYLRIHTTNKISLSNMKISGCSSLWFGEKCDKQCHCANNRECHMMTGSCPMGCESGRRGPDCQTLNYVNVALNKKAWQSSTHNSFSILINDTGKSITKIQLSANLAVDGNTDLTQERRSCIQTNLEENTNWNVDLGKEYNISQMRIYYQKDKLWSLFDVEIKVDHQFCYKIKTASKILDIKCDKTIYGRTIEFTKKLDVLSICEVEVFQCLSGFYGSRCNNSCPECKNSSCDQWSGQCLLGCELGYHLNKTCTVCPIGTFGEQCSQVCHCKNNNYCNKKNGTCEPKICETGYKGDNCQEVDILAIGCALGALLLLFMMFAGYVIYFKGIKRRKERRHPLILPNPHPVAMEINPHPHAVEINPDLTERILEILPRNGNNFVRRENIRENATETTSENFNRGFQNRNVEHIYNYVLESVNIPTYFEIINDRNDSSIANSIEDGNYLHTSIPAASQENRRLE